MPCSFFEASSDAAELLELAAETFDMATLVAEIGVISRVCDCHPGIDPVDQVMGKGDIVTLPGDFQSDEQEGRALR